jgi:pSer/pThr/pTyr-binding forkhead associated (FHA) protein
MAHRLPTADQSVAELQRQIELEREGVPFVIHRAPDGTQHLLSTAGRERLTVGREEGLDVDLTGDGEVSRLHAEIVAVGGAWVVVDDGLSRNGTFVNGERVRGRRRLADRDLILVGGTGILFRDPAARALPEATAAASSSEPPQLGETQRRVLVALCRPLASGQSFAAAPATNGQIAAELFISVAAVKANLRVLFTKFGVDDEAQNSKRAALADRALKTGAIHPSDLS